MSEDQHDVTEAISTVNRLLKSARNENEAMIALCTEIALLNGQNRRLQERLTRVFMELEHVKEENDKLRGNRDDSSSRSNRDGSSSGSMSSKRRSNESMKKKLDKPSKGSFIRENFMKSDDSVPTKNFITTKADIHKKQESVVPQPTSVPNYHIENTIQNNNNERGLGRSLSSFEEQLRHAIKGRFKENEENKNPVNPFGKIIMSNYNPAGPLFPSKDKREAIVKKEAVKTSSVNPIEKQTNPFTKPFPARRMSSHDTSARNDWYNLSENGVTNSRTDSFLYDLHY